MKPEESKDRELVTYAERLWATEEYQSWRKGLKEAQQDKNDSD